MAGVGPLDREGGPGSRKALTSAAEELSRYRTAMTLAGANPEAWALIRDGVNRYLDAGAGAAVATES